MDPILLVFALLVTFLGLVVLAAEVTMFSIMGIGLPSAAALSATAMYGAEVILFVVAAVAAVVTVVAHTRVK